MKEFEKAHADPVIEMLRNFMRCCKKVFIHVSARLVGKDSMRNHRQIRKNFTGI